MDTSEKLILCSIIAACFVLIKVSMRKMSSKHDENENLELRDDVKNSFFVFASTFVGLYVFNMYSSYQTSSQVPDVFISNPEF